MQSDLGLCCLSRPFGQTAIVQNFRTFTVTKVRFISIMVFHHRQGEHLLTLAVSAYNRYFVNSHAS